LYQRLTSTPEIGIPAFTLTAADVAGVLGARGIARDDEYARPIFDNIPREIERRGELERGTDRMKKKTSRLARLVAAQSEVSTTFLDRTGFGED